MKWKLASPRYELLHVVRTHMGSSDASYGCVFQKEDSEGKVGVFLSKELMSIAGHALKANITTLGPLVLPLSEQILFFLNLIARKVSISQLHLLVLRENCMCRRVSVLADLGYMYFWFCAFGRGSDLSIRELDALPWELQSQFYLLRSSHGPAYNDLQNLFACMSVICLCEMRSWSSYYASQVHSSDTFCLISGAEDQD